MLLRTIKVFILEDIYVDKDSPSQKKHTADVETFSCFSGWREADESAQGTLKIIALITIMLMRTYRVPLTWGLKTYFASLKSKKKKIGEF